MGMKQRLGIASVILSNPEILILDESINGLAPQGIKEIRELIKRLNEAFEMTIIISSHILSELDLVAGRFGIVDHGVLVQEVDKKDFNSKDHIVIETQMVEKVMDVFKKHQIGAKVQSLSTITVSDSHIIVNNIIKMMVRENVEIQGINSVKSSL